MSGVGRRMNIVLGEASAVSMIYDTQQYESFWNSHVIIILCFTDEDLVKKKNTCNRIMVFFLVLIKT